MRFTTDGSPTFEDGIARDLNEIFGLTVKYVEPKDLTALVLGGGYGRSEGGVYIQNGVERVYNDYDFFVIVPTRSWAKRRSIMRTLSQIKTEMEPRCGIHVDFSPPMPLGSLSSLPYELMFMELKAGHRVVIGPQDILSAMPDYDEAHPPLEECARLFMNRGVGLLLARQKLTKATALVTEDHEFVVRNIRKAQLAMGDCILFLRGCYSASYLKRRERFFMQDLSDAPIPETLMRYYSEAIEFKLRPQHDIPIGHSLASWHKEVTDFYERMFLWFEQQRLGMPALTWEHYRGLPHRLPYRGLRESALNVVRNLRLKTTRPPRPSELWLHPRDRVLAELPNQLFGTTIDERACRDMLALWQYAG